MSLAAEALKIACVVVPIVATGLFGIDKIIRETDARVATIRAELDSTARMEMIKKFADNSADPREVFRSVAILLRLGLLADDDRRLARAVFDYYGTRVEDLSLSELAYRQRRDPQSLLPEPSPAAPPGDRPGPQLAGGDGQPPAAGQGATRPTAAAPAPAGSIAVLAVQLDSSDTQTRRAATQRLVDLARLGAAEARDLLGPLIDQVTEPQILGLSATGRLNTLSVLAEVRPATWADNPAEAARLRASLAAIETRRAAGAVAIGTTTAAAIERILGNLPRG